MIPSDILASLREITLLSVCIRLVLAMLFGGTIGLERGIRQRAAGLRTHMFLCIGAASTMLVSQYLYSVYNTGDPARLSAQVISGIGFLGAGTIIVTRRNQVKGLTTAATLWATACMGIAIGIGFYECAFVMYILLVIILLLIGPMDNRYLKIPTNTSVYLEVQRSEGLGNVIHYIHSLNWTIRDVREIPSGREEILAVQLDLESENAHQGDLAAIALLREEADVFRLEM